jgi:PleD family two-component response regulator
MLTGATMTAPPLSPPSASLRPLLNVLMVEDMPEDFELLVRELEHAGLPVCATRVTTESELTAELRRHEPDIVLSDHAGTSFDSFRVLAQVRAWFPGIPFLLVTGALDRELMLRAFERGVDDWVCKSQLSEILPAMLRALRLAEERGHRQRLELDLLGRSHDPFGPDAPPSLGRIVRVCAGCRKILADENRWVSFESCGHHFDMVKFQSGLCPWCTEAA